MKQDSPGLLAALKSGERSASHITRLGGRDVSAQIGSWSLDRSYGTDLPTSMRAFSGSTSAQLAVGLAGKGGVSAPALYGAWAPRATGDVARPGQSVTHVWGLGGAAPLDDFRGTVRARSAASGTDLVNVSALDGAERLRMPAQLPRPAGGIDPATPYVSSTNWAASATWCVDHLIRNGGIHTSPPPRAGCIFYASMHGGAAANIGSLTKLSGDWTQWTKTHVPHEMAIQGSATGTVAEYAPAVRPVNRGNAPGLYYEAWVNNYGVSTGTRKLECTITWNDATNKKTYTSILLDFATGSLGMGAGPNPDVSQNPTNSWSNTEIAKWQGDYHVALYITFNASGAPVFSPLITDPYGKVYFEGWDPGIGLTVPAGTVSSIRIGVTGIRAEAIQLSQLAAIPTGAAITQRGLWKKTAILDTPDVPVRVIPQTSGSAWEAITQIAKATLSTAEFDADGFFRWRGRSRWATAPTVPAVTVTSARELAAMTVTEEIDACRNFINVDWDNWANVKASTSISNPMGNVVGLTAGQYYETWWPVGQNEFDPIPPMTAATVAADCIRFVNANTDAAPVVHGAVEVGIRREAGKLFLTLRNRSTATVWMRGATSGAVSADVRSPAIPSGSSPVGFTATAQSTASQAAYGVQTFTHSASGWVQDSASADSLAAALLRAGEYPYPLLGDIQILPDPRLQLGDVVRVVDTTGAKLDTLAWIIGIRLSAANGSITQTLTLRGSASNGFPADTGLTPDPPTRLSAPPPT